MNDTLSIQVGNNISFVPVLPIGSYDIQATMLGIADYYSIVNSKVAFVPMDIHDAIKDGKEALIISLYGCTNIQGQIDLLRIYYNLGVRHIMLCYKNQNNIGSGCDEHNDSGISVFAGKVIHEIAKLGMVIDLAYAGHRTQRETLDIIEDIGVPCIASSECAARSEESSWQLKDDIAERIAASGGVIILRDEANLDHFTKLLGPEHIVCGDDPANYLRVVDQVWKGKSA